MGSRCNIPALAISYLVSIVVLCDSVSCSLNYNDALILHSPEIGIEKREAQKHNIQKRDTGVEKNVEVFSFKVQSDIKYRYCRTSVTSHVINRDISSHEVTFQVILPETAFISKFSMEIDGEVYEAYVKEKDEAKRVYNEAQIRGQNAGLIELNTRHSNVFNVNVNIKAQAKINFNLTYEELLQRRLGRYEQSINIRPDQVTNFEDIEIMVNIEESQDITLIHIPNLRNEIEVEDDYKDQNDEALIERPAANLARITWRPSKSEQAKLRNTRTGQVGKFVVQYDVAKEQNAGEVLIMNGYFVHFFAPTNLKPLQKHVVFVLDISGSMMGRKIEQLREAMRKILGDLNRDDFLNIIIFSSTITHWAPGDLFIRRSDYGFHHTEMFGGDFGQDRSWKTQPFIASADNILHAKSFTDSLIATDGTNIHDALNDALNLISNLKNTRRYYYSGSPASQANGEMHGSDWIKEYQQPLPLNVEPLLIFLTDGEPTVGVTNPSEILSRIRSVNSRIYVPIFSLAFGESADFTFLRRLSLQNHGFARKIYEAADAVLQLKGFYNEIASPLLANVKFNYTSPDYDVEGVTNIRFATLFGGSELAVAGQITPRVAAENSGKSLRPMMPIRDGDSLIRYIPNDECYFPLGVDGIGREGHRFWHRPIVYSHWNWWCHHHPPIPPPPTTRRPIVTQEDSFLERLWAYLTIQQLIDKDFAQDSQDLTRHNRYEESPRQRALRIALKYGFVTSLTSLVVVKPTGYDETGIFSADRKQNSGVALQGQSFLGAGSNGGGGHFGKSSLRKAGHFSAQPFNGGPQSSVDYSEAAPSRPSFISKSTPMAAEEDADADRSESLAKPSQDADKDLPTTPTKSELEKSKSDSKKEKRHSKGLTLNDILWLTDYTITVRVNGDNDQFRIIQQDSEAKPADETDVDHECKSVGNRKGQCKHLKDCIKSAFIDDFELYKKSYFCPIQDLKAVHSFYAGVCCTKKHR